MRSHKRLRALDPQCGRHVMPPLVVRVKKKECISCIRWKLQPRIPPAQPGVHVQRLGWLEPKLRERRPHPDRVMRGELRRLLYQPTEHQRHPRHMLPAQPGLHVQRLERLERELW